jgi:two-component system, OmpR family, response regulator
MFTTAQTDSIGTRVLCAVERRILVVEDDPTIGSLLAGFLGEHGYRVLLAAESREMDRILATQRVDLLILDIMLPGEDGLSICRRVRATDTVPVIILTARSSEIDHVVGLEMGADDYLTKPFGTQELLARIRALFRRIEAPRPVGQARWAATIRFSGWALDLRRRVLHDPAQIRVLLTAAEYRLLVAFCERPNRTLNREQLLDLTRERGSEVNDRCIDIQVSRLRRKIERDPRMPELIQTVRAGGYVFAAAVELG